MSEAARGMSGLMQTLTALEYACTLDVLPALKRIFASGERGPVFAKGYAFCSGADAMDLALHSDRQTLSVMENHDFHTLANEEGEDHIAHRKEVMAAFSPALLKRYGEVAERIATDTYGEPGASLVNLYEVTESFVQKLLWETLLGEPFDERPSHVLLDYQLLLARADNSARFRPSSIQAAKDRWNSYLLEILSKRYQLPKQDAASAIVRARKEPDAVGVSHLFALMDFGLGDLSIFFTYVLALLGIHREAQRSIRSELLGRSGSTLEEFPRTAAFVHEVERLYPPVVELHRLVK
ncbi:MAG: hypothetical protein KBF88_16905, partial [Polyangiaceae bacterium]|nr:hypothetical protein [Polyangiaceae bacterium]